MNFAPIALFAYSRPKHLQRAVDSLLANSVARDSLLYVFCDGAKKEEHRAAVKDVKDYAHRIHGFKQVVVVESEKNLGLSNSVIQGVSSVIQKHGAVIVVEDDLVVSPHFLEYMNEGLRKYEQEEQVASIHGYCYPLGTIHAPEAFFIKGADCWGWATWERAWRLFQPDGARLLKELVYRKLEHAFDLDGSYGYTKMLRDQIRGKNDSWAIRWHASMFLRGMLTLYPGKSLVSNEGHDGSGTHCGSDHSYVVDSTGGVPTNWPTEVAENAHMRTAFIDYFRRIQRSQWLIWRILRKARKCVSC